jgi:hypothetical protein
MKEQLKTQANPQWRNGNDAKVLVDDLLAVRKGGTIRIFCAEATPSFYNREEFLTAARKVKEMENASIHVITGPIVVTDDKGFNGILHLAKKGIIDRLYHRSVRSHTAHFRVVETDNGYRFHPELPHPALDRKRHVANIGSLSEGEVQLLAKEAVALFESWEEGLKKFPAEDLPLLMSENLLEALLKKAEKRTLVFEYLSPEELKALQQSSS